MGLEREYSYRVVDVFTEHPFEGNALAVFPDASTMDAATMQRIARARAPRRSGAAVRRSTTGRTDRPSARSSAHAHRTNDPL